MQEILYPTPNKSGEFLRDARLSLGLTVPEAARAVGCSARTLRRYESQGLPNGILVSRVFGLCRAYGISADHLADLARTQA